MNKKNYTLRSGSTIITFTDEYLATLKTGKHSLTARFTDGGAATTNFTLAKATATTTKPAISAPNTGVVTTAEGTATGAVNLEALLVCGVVLGGYLVLRKAQEM